MHEHTHRRQEKRETHIEETFTFVSAKEKKNKSPPDPRMNPKNNHKSDEFI